MAEREFNLDEERARRRPARRLSGGPLDGQPAPNDGSTVVCWRDESEGFVPIMRVENVRPGQETWTGERCKHIGQRLIGIYTLGSSGQHRWMPGRKDTNGGSVA